MLVFSFCHYFYYHLQLHDTVFREIEIVPKRLHPFNKNHNVSRSKTSVSQYVSYIINAFPE